MMATSGMEAAIVHYEEREPLQPVKSCIASPQLGLSDRYPRGNRQKYENSRKR